MRSILEHTQEFSALGEIIKWVSASDDPIVLGSLADTLNYHCTTFEALESLQDCFDILLQRYQSLRARKITEMSLLRSLADLATRLPRTQDIGRHLSFEMSGNIYKGSIAAFSPVSNPTMEVSHSADSEFQDEVERLLSSGSSIDKQTLERLFDNIMIRIEDVSDRQRSGESNFSLNNLLVKLRCLDIKGFDELMEARISDTMKGKHSMAYFQVLASMVVAGCLSFSSITTCSAKLLELGAENDMELKRAGVAIGTLQLLTSTSSDVIDQVSSYPNRCVSPAISNYSE